MHLMITTSIGYILPWIYDAIRIWCHVEGNDKMSPPILSLLMQKWSPIWVYQFLQNTSIRVKRTKADEN